MTSNMKMHGRSCGTLALAGLAAVALASSGCDKPSPARAPAPEATTQGVRVDAAETTGRHRVVFELTSDEHEQWEKVLNNVENVRKALGPDKTDVEVVMHGNGL